MFVRHDITESFCDVVLTDVQGGALETDDTADSAAVPERRVRHLLQPQHAGVRPHHAAST